MMGRSSFDLSAFPEPTVPHFYKYGTDLHWLEALIAKSELFIPTAEELKATARTAVRSSQSPD
jgi:hypothetical protein